jgi:hypothetical protein
MANSPYSTKFASGEIKNDLDTTQMFKQYKKEEKDAEAPNILPYELGDLPMHYGDLIDSGIQACKILETALKMKEVKNKKSLSILKKNTEKMVVYLLKNVDSILEKQTIGANHEGDEDEKYEELS